LAVVLCPKSAGIISKMAAKMNLLLAIAINCVDVILSEFLIACSDSTADYKELPIYPSIRRERQRMQRVHSLHPFSFATPIGKRHEHLVKRIAR
jgi:hypothetical protein